MSGFGILTLLYTIAWIAPMAFIACSSQITKYEKIAWIIAITFISWFAFIIYLLVRKIKINRLKIS
ncbi:hypothetical protein [uncultured Shewanella sp.]|uniref:hypothetical protein n=1 Tax=uncultured Shewanella sp. TaxID=173975 RepID=UPI002617B684|nr:hypothetical protein [uncultured Shewanella sp.]